MKTDKYIYEFSIDNEIEKEIVEISKNEKGEEVKTLKKVKEKSPVYFRILRPDRKTFEEAELFYGVKVSEGIRLGLLTKSLIAKRYQDDGGALSESEKQRYATLYVTLYVKQTELEKVQANLTKLEKEDQEAKMKDLLNEILNIKKDLANLELQQSSVFDQTAENRARNQVILWWVLNLSYVSYDEKITFSPIFKGLTFENKLTAYDLIEDQSDLVLSGGIRKLAYFISLWYMGKASTEEEFKSLEEFFDS
jgi:HPt (histidine-containing phosphotransfer) domain-containing protein